MFDRPAAGRAWFEQTLVDQLTLGRPDHVSIMLGRKINRSTPGRFHTQIIHAGVDPTIQAHYKHSKVKQYYKEGRAPRTETTIDDPNDFGVGRLLSAANWTRLLTIGEQTNQRLLAIELEACDCMQDPETFTRLVSPSAQDGLPAPAPRFGDPRVMALLSRLCSFTHLFAGLTNRSPRDLMAGLIPGYTANQMTYDLRRLRGKGLIRRVPRSHRYELTEQVNVYLGKSPRSTSRSDRGRDRRCRRPPARIPACASTHWAPPLGSGVEARFWPGVKDAGLG